MQDKVDELRNYVVKRVNENTSDLSISENAWRSHTRDVVEGVLRSIAEQEPDTGVRIVCDESNNPQYNIDNNMLTVDVIITNPAITRLIFEQGNNNAKTSIGFIQQETVVPKEL